jgi:hypothetical protein
VFTAKGYDVDEYFVPIEESWTELGKKLDEFLESGTEKTMLILYYHGHGGVDNGSLVLAR